MDVKTIDTSAGGSINEPHAPSRQTFSPVSINEPPTIDEINPPKATGLNPTGVAIGDPPQTLHVNGMNFTSDTLIVFDEVHVVTQFVSVTELTAALDPSAFVEARGYPVTVALGPYTAQPATMFTVTEAAQDDPDEMEDEIDAARDDGDFKPTHASRPKTKKKR
jgi:hypothetical protein